MDLLSGSTQGPWTEEKQNLDMHTAMGTEPSLAMQTRLQVTDQAKRLYSNLSSYIANRSVLYTYICTSRAYLFVCMYIYIHIHIYIHIPVHVYISISIYVYIFMIVFVCVCLFEVNGFCVYIYIYRGIHISSIGPFFNYNSEIPEEPRCSPSFWVVLLAPRSCPRALALHPPTFRASSLAPPNYPFPKGPSTNIMQTLDT